MYHCKDIESVDKIYVKHRGWETINFKRKVDIKALKEGKLGPLEFSKVKVTFNAGLGRIDVKELTISEFQRVLRV